uniref:Protein phosphatase 1d n=1 Tax=Anopheles braziliensis TaxID=58242 RepID=A0A2M3Z5T5_9DIPT
MSIGVNIRVTGHTSVGGRKYQEDFFSVAYQQTENEQNLEYAFFGIYDGHGGAEASLFAKEHLMNTIVSQKLFWSENDTDVLKSIREGYIQTHHAMWREQDKWPKTSSGLPSTAGTTASIAFIRRGKIYIGHVGDSGIVLGYQRDRDPANEGSVHDDPHPGCRWVATPLTKDHKPESTAEKMRIMSCGGKVVAKSGVPRVVWNRPRIGHKGPVRRSTPFDEIPFLAVARSLGDLWSYNSAVNKFIVSPVPDVSVIKIDPKRFRCLIFGTDGLWNVLTPKNAVDLVRNAEMENVRIALEGRNEWKNPSKLLVNEALDRWSRSNMKADNTSVVIIMLDPPGPPKRDVLRSVKNTIQRTPEYRAPSETGAPSSSNNMYELFDCITRGDALPSMPLECNYHHHHPVPDYQQPVVHQYAPTSNSLYSHDEHQQHQIETDDQYCPTETTSTSYHDLSYSSDSFAESYNSLLDRSFENTDHSYTNSSIYTSTTAEGVVEADEQNHQPDDDEDDTLGDSDDSEPHADHHSDASYSLTNLQTKSERLRAEMVESSHDPYYHGQHYAGGYCGANVAIIEDFHNYTHHQYTGDEERGSASANGGMNHGYDHGSSYHQHQHHHTPSVVGYHHHQGVHEGHQQHSPAAAFQMERYDYRLNNSALAVPCEPSCSTSPPKTLPRMTHEYPSYEAYDELSSPLHVCGGGDGGGDSVGDAEMDPETEESPPSSPEPEVQSNEISSSYVLVDHASLSPSSASGASGDEENKASSTTSKLPATTRAIMNRIIKSRAKKGGQSSSGGGGGTDRVLTIFYETRSNSQRKVRKRSAAEAGAPELPGALTPRTRLHSKRLKTVIAPSPVRSSLVAPGGALIEGRRALRSNNEKQECGRSGTGGRQQPSPLSPSLHHGFNVSSTTHDHEHLALRMRQIVRTGRAAAVAGCPATSQRMLPTKGVVSPVVKARSSNRLSSALSTAHRRRRCTQ